MRDSVIAQCCPSGWLLEESIRLDTTVTTLLNCDLDQCPQGIIVIEATSELSSAFQSNDNSTTITANGRTFVVTEVRHPLCTSVLSEFVETLRNVISPSTQIHCGLYSTETNSYLVQEGEADLSSETVNWLGELWLSVDGGLVSQWKVPSQYCRFVSSIAIEEAVKDLLKTKTDLHTIVQKSPFQFPSVVAVVEGKRLVFQFPRLGATHIMVFALGERQDWQAYPLPKSVWGQPQGLTLFVKVEGLLIAFRSQGSIKARRRCCELDGSILGHYVDSRSIIEHSDFLKTELSVWSQFVTKVCQHPHDRQAIETTMTANGKLISLASRQVSQGRFTLVLRNSLPKDTSFDVIYV